MDRSEKRKLTHSSNTYSNTSGNSTYYLHSDVIGTTTTHTSTKRSRKSSSKINHSSTMWRKGSASKRKNADATTNRWNEAKVLKIFDDTLAEPDDDTIATMEGVCKFCELIEIDAMEDIRILVLLWKMEVGEDRPAQITRDEWKKGCMKLNIDTIEKFKQLLPTLDTGFLVASEFREFYKFCFRFNCEGTYKTIAKDMIMELNPMVLKGRIPEERLGQFKGFLEKTDDTSYNRITLDQWMSFLDFSLENPDIDQYDEENSAWPTLIDDYVDYLKEKM